jgi:O-antigen ligase
MRSLRSLLDLSRQQLEEQEIQLARWTIIAVVLFSSFYLSPRIALGHRNPRLLGLLIIGIVAVIVLVRYPHLGLITLIPVSMIIPFSIGTGSQTSLNATVLFLVLLIGIWLLDIVVHRRKLSLLPSRTITTILIFILVSLLSFCFGQLHFFAIDPAPFRAQLGGFAIFLLSAGAFLLVAHQIKEIQGLQWMTWAFITLGGLFLIGRLIPGAYRYTDRIFQYGSTGSLFYIWLVSLAGGQLIFNRDLAIRWRLVLGIVVSAVFFIGLVQARDWASGWLPPLIALGLIFWFRFPRAGSLIAMAALLLLVFKSSNLLYAVTSDTQGTLFPWQARLAAWQIVLEVSKKSPILGLGFSNYYYYVELHPILGYYVPFNSHNNYIDILAQTGILGLIILFWFFMIVWLEGWNLRKYIKPGFATGYLYACLGGLVGTLISGLLGDWFLPFVYNVGLTGFRTSVLGWVFLGGLIALKQIQKRESIP